MALSNYISDEKGFSTTTEGATEIRSREVISSALKHQHNFYAWPVAYCETNDAPQNATAMSAFSLFQPFYSLLYCIRISVCCHTYNKLFNDESCTHKNGKNVTVNESTLILFQNVASVEFIIS
jgi:hypothetical protein